MSHNRIKLKNITAIKDFSQDLFNYMKSEDSLISLDGNTIVFPYVFLPSEDNDNLLSEKEFSKHKPFVEKFIEFISDQKGNFSEEFETAFISYSNNYYYINFIVNNEKHSFFNSVESQILIEEMYEMEEENYDSEGEYLEALDEYIYEIIKDFTKGIVDYDLFDYANM